MDQTEHESKDDRLKYDFVGPVVNGVGLAIGWNGRQSEKERNFDGRC
jgi:hypothetical protein